MKLMKTFVWIAGLSALMLLSAPVQGQESATTNSTVPAPAKKASAKKAAAKPASGGSATKTAEAQGQHDELGTGALENDAGGLSNPHPGAQWFPEAGFGLFIHWTMSAVHGGADASWSMLANKPWLGDGTITPNEYWGLTNQWKADRFDMDKTLKAAKEAGFKYAVFVTKHHDGFTFWPTEYGEIGTRQTFAGRDFVKEFVDACRKYDLKVGLYYSPPDWYFDREYRSFSLKGPYLDVNHKPSTKKPKPAGHDEARAELVRNHVRELLTRYGKIDLIFFDGGRAEMPNSEIRKLQPGIVINKRNKDVLDKGDYGDSEGKPPEVRFKGWFEFNDTCWPSAHWAYSASDNMDDASTVLCNLIKMRAWGGNYLANVGPCGSGEVLPEVYAVWREIGQWMAHSGESIYGVKGGSYPEKATVPVTVKDNVAYCFALPPHQGYVTLQDVKAPKSVTLLRTKTPLQYEYTNGVMRLQLPPALRTRLPDVVKVEF